MSMTMFSAATGCMAAPGAKTSPQRASHSDYTRERPTADEMWKLINVLVSEREQLRREASARGDAPVFEAIRHTELVTWAKLNDFVAAARADIDEQRAILRRGERIRWWVDA
jgi:hypothetical protein